MADELTEYCIVTDAAGAVIDTQIPVVMGNNRAQELANERGQPVTLKVNDSNWSRVVKPRED